MLLERVRSGNDVTLRDVIDDTLPKLDEKFEGRPRVEGSIRRTLGVSYRWLGQLDIAEDPLRLALDAYERAESIDKMEVVETKDQLACVLRSRDDDAVAYMQATIDLVGKERGPKHKYTLRAK